MPDGLLHCLDGIHIEWMHVILLTAFVLVIWVLWKVQRGFNSVDLRDLILGEDGKASWSKMSAMGGWCVGTWIVVYLTMHDKMTLPFYLVYFCVVIGSPMAFAIINLWKGQPPAAPEAKGDNP
jgi:hypothetical protein